jgi:hypothetical protein
MQQEIADRPLSGSEVESIQERAIATDFVLAGPLFAICESEAQTHPKGHFLSDDG